jgi:pimeloyl-ACP methyl ester carboxylesterase
VSFPDTQYARNGDVWLAYQVWGEGPVDLVLVPGYMTHLEQNTEWLDWVRLLERVASFTRLIVFDRRGTGLSDRILSLGSFEETMGDIGAVMDAAGSERAYVWGGAEGGPQSILFAATHPARVHGLVLYASYARRRWAPDYPWGFPDEVLEQAEAAYEERYGRGPFGVRLAAPSLGNDPRFRAYYTRASRYAGTPGSALAWFRITNDIDVRGVLPAIRVPTLVVHRTDDRAAPVEAARWMADQIPGAKFVELPGDDHLVFVGDGDAVIADIEQFVTGSRRAPELHRVLSTLLFTDIVGSTERAAELGDRGWTALLEDHHRVVRRELELFAGQEIDTAGDGFLATFDGPARGVRCAQAVQSGLHALGIDVRAGLHTGEIEQRDNKVAGLAVHIGARVMAAAAPGEVLVSSTVKDLVVGSGIEFSDRGAHALKGVPGEWRLFSVVG